MKKLYVIALSVLMVLQLSSCESKVSSETYSELQAIVTTSNEQQVQELTFQMEASFSDPSTGETGVLYFLSGTTVCDRNQGIAEQSYSATLLADSYKGKDLLKDGIRTHMEGEDTYQSECDPEAFFSGFPYSRILLPAVDDISSLEKADSLNGINYIVSSTEQGNSLLDSWGLDLYGLAGISNPDKDKQSIEKLKYTFSVSDQVLKSITIDMTVVIYEEAAYRPGYSSDADSRLELSIRTNISFVHLGSDVVFSEE